MILSGTSTASDFPTACTLFSGPFLLKIETDRVVFPSGVLSLCVVHRDKVCGIMLVYYCSTSGDFSVIDARGIFLIPNGFTYASLCGTMYRVLLMLCSALCAFRLTSVTSFLAGTTTWCNRDDDSRRSRDQARRFDNTEDSRVTALQPIKAGAYLVLRASGAVTYLIMSSSMTYVMYFLSST
ncbi:uncharacterized protein C8R40DRAFT_489992 [Lentinula edodes]|uniref:uncharacterized protein n=1 Tax=Lentinula edodes TaxID=5353 RepID=UPI001E8DB153|nr:uncharacterized protein C8R40DRAFT_489992 [Lentinula edodes]KAH7872532.1 hypothetical protein C8R40DRAFT_489992 [Lentinula edodes]